MEVSQRFNKKLKVNAVDIDMFANVVRHESELDEMEHLLYNLRRTRRTVDTLESTHHAVCRSYFRTSNHDRLLEIMKKRVDYGIFPDHFCYNLLLDHYIESKKWKNGAKVGTCYMLQEDYKNEITNILSIHAIHEYVKNPEREEWEVLPVEAEEMVEEDEDDVEYIRVPVIKNEYFDDHFDIKDGLKLCGKSLHFIGSTFEEPLKSNLRLLGLVFHCKWSEVLSLLEESGSYGKDTVDIIMNHIGSVGREEKEAESGEKEAESGEKEVESGEKEVESVKRKLSNLNISKELRMDDLISKELEKIPVLEKKDMVEMNSLFDQWILDRKSALKRSLDELMRDQRIKEIMEKRRELKEKEKLLFFFENINKHEMELKEAEEKISELQSAAVVEDEYVPPKI